jgi:hydrogenase expression/formation protein HypE
MKHIELSHGGGGEESDTLIKELFYKHFENDILLKAEDAAVLQVAKKIAFTTDSYTVTPLFFNGGDIGKIAIAGTVNDLSMMGAKPLYLSAAFIIEEGFLLEDLSTIVQNMASELKHSGAKIVCGDTKVVPRGSVDQLFINTSGIGEILKEGISASNIQEDDTIITSGDIGRHGSTILINREGLEVNTKLQSDCQSVWPATQALLQAGIPIHAMRDATRGGLSAVLNEWAKSSNVCLEIEEAKVPICDEVQGICEIFGFDAMDFANEGTFILALPAKEAARCLEILQQFSLCKEAAIIGTVSQKHPNKVILHSPYGSSRFLDLPKGELLPRIC